MTTSANAPETLTLHWSPKSPYVRKVMVTAIEKGLDGLFRVKGGGVLPMDADARVIPGALEQSNVVPSQVLVDMIEAQRLFEIRTNVVSTARELDEGSARLMRLDG